MSTTTDQMKAVAAMIASHLDDNGIRVTLVGGLAVSFYTENQYLTNDIDMVDTDNTPGSKLNPIMAELGFKKSGRVFIHPDYDFSVEFPTAPLSVGGEIITQVDVIETPNGRIPILKVNDVVKDRLAAFIHWKDLQSLAQALSIIQIHNLKFSEKFSVYCQNEGGAGSKDLIAKHTKYVAEHNLKGIDEISEYLISYQLANL